MTPSVVPAEVQFLQFLLLGKSEGKVGHTFNLDG